MGQVHLFGFALKLSAFQLHQVFISSHVKNLIKKKKCKIFALNRKIKLSNSDKMPVNLLKFNQSDSLHDVKKKLKKLGFID